MAGRLRVYLVDTNVWLERLLDQEKSDPVGRFLDSIPSERLALTDFSLHSIGIIMNRLQKLESFGSFVEDAFVQGGVRLVRLEPEDMPRLVAIIAQFQLDFDDAYQYVAAEKHDLILVSFDQDFDRTSGGRKTPEEILSA